ncbi:TonB-dependent receptor plug domain-containing protein [Porticoccaceae bacterium LTM1]|nr:TonB-dependent receptor plug domain-containing protein [Porticoccaceae bacterium LTM1]
MKHRLLALCLFATFLFSAVGAHSSSKTVNTDDVPELLKPWVPWVLHNQDQQFCPVSATAFQQKICQWPGVFSLQVGSKQATFQQQWTAYSKGEIVLPGNTDMWPVAVTLNGRAAVVLNRSNRPVIQVEAGEYNIAGTFRWQQRPNQLQLAPDIALVQMQLDGEAVLQPEIDRAGSLRLNKGSTVAIGEDWLKFSVSRLLVDDVPTRLETVIALEVAGKAREQIIGPVLMEGFRPINIESSLPARIEPDGTIRVQVRPGRWQLKLVAVALSPQNSFGFSRTDLSWPAQEYWAFQARPELRLVDIKGANLIDGSRTDMYQQWQSLPTYRLTPDSTLVLEEVRRGSAADDYNQLNLSRELWVDFAGEQFRFRDLINGKMIKDWRMDATSALSLGRVEINGEDQLLTTLEGSDRVGVEVRQSRLNLLAEGELEDSWTLPANGWGVDMDAVDTTLNLPPGWRVMAVVGADYSKGDWVTRWTLLDLFLVLLAAVAVWKLWGWPAGVIALLGLALSWHEPNAPQVVWLNLIAAAALWRLAIQGWPRYLVRGYWLASILALVVVAVPFAVQQAKSALYPQLEPTGFGAVSKMRAPSLDEGLEEVVVTGARVQSATNSKQIQVITPDELEGLAAGSGVNLRGLGSKDALILINGRRIDPNGAYGDFKSLADIPTDIIARIEILNEGASATYGNDGVGGVVNIITKDSEQALVQQHVSVQTGLGIPDWKWRQVHIGWNGKVASDYNVSLWLLPPWLTKVMLLAQLLLLAGLLLKLLGLSIRIPLRKALPVIPLALTTLLFSAPDAQAQSVEPSSEILRELRQRLLKAPDCAPNCAQLEKAHITIKGDQLTVEMVAHAGTDVAFPLPASRENWLPQRVELDGKSSHLLTHHQASLWLNLSPGVHRLVLQGKVVGDEISLPFALAAHVVEVTADGWQVAGLNPNQQNISQIQLIREQDETEQQENKVSGTLPLVEVRRNINMGLLWQVSTAVTRKSDSAQPLVLSIPLLPGESVVSDRTTVEGNKVQVSMKAGESRVYWQSALEIQPSLTLTAQSADSWYETWQVNPSPDWHLEYKGLSPIYQQNTERWAPFWQPWQGQTVTLVSTRPEGVIGSWNTIDNSTLQLVPSVRSTDATFSWTMRSSQGGKYQLMVPEGVQVRGVTVDGDSQPVRQTGNILEVPLKPGESNFKISWQQPQGVEFSYQSPAVDLQMPSVNGNTKIEFPENRWVLWLSGPSMGPAVMFWGLILVLVMIGWGLGRSQYTPLKSWQWILLLIGLSQAPLTGGIMVVIWLLGLAWLHKQPRPVNWLCLLYQIAMVVLTIIALTSLYAGIAQGLLDSPQMQIAGNDSYWYDFNWYADRVEGVLPTVSVISVPIWVYRVLTLLWALWIAFALISWLRWGIKVFQAYMPHFQKKSAAVSKTTEQGQQQTSTD